MKQKKDVRLFGELREYYLFFLMLIIGIIAGTCYALSVKEDTVFLYLFNQYVSLEHLEATVLERMKYCFFTYGKKVFLFLVCMLFPVTYPIAGMLFILLCFSYGFTSTCFILLYGTKGIMMALLAIGLQSAGLILLAFYIHKKLKQTRDGHYKIGIKNYGGELLKVLIILMMLVSVDSLLQPFIQRMIQWMI